MSFERIFCKLHKFKTLALWQYPARAALGHFATLAICSGTSCPLLPRANKLPWRNAVSAKILIKTFFLIWPSTFSRPRPFSNLYRYILQQGQLGHALRQPVTVEECGLSENPAPMMEDWEPPPRLPSWLGYSQPRGVCHFQVLPIFFLQKDFQPLQLQSFLQQGRWPAVTYMKGLNSCQLRAWPLSEMFFLCMYMRDWNIFVSGNIYYILKYKCSCECTIYIH